jgi:hypothetical protein
MNRPALLHQTRVPDREGRGDPPRDTHDGHGHEEEWEADPELSTPTNMWFVFWRMPYGTDQHQHERSDNEPEQRILRQWWWSLWASFMLAPVKQTQYS